MINVSKLHDELKNASLPVVSVRSTGEIEYSRALTPEEQALADAVIQAHDPVDYAAERQVESVADARLVTQLAKVTPQQAVDYIEANVIDLASAKAVLKLMARMLIALRNHAWPQLPDE